MVQGRGPFGRETALDMPAPYDVAAWYYEGRAAIAQDAGILRRLIEAVGWTNDLWPSQWAQWYSVALGFRPDLVLELGRGRGNSTAVFTQAASASRSSASVTAATGRW